VVGVGGLEGKWWRPFPLVLFYLSGVLFYFEGDPKKAILLKSVFFAKENLPDTRFGYKSCNDNLLII
jgi:hypothetical protein